jgi:hypothetical protein
MVVRLAPVAAALGAALLMPAGAGAAYRDFRSPSGTIVCAFYSDAETPRFVRCDWRGAGDHALRLTDRGKGKRIDATDTVMNPEAKVLAYGKATQFGTLRRTSRRSGITCRSTRSNHGFTVSVEKQRVF